MILLNQIEKIYNKQVLTRFKDYGTVYYFSEKDFPGMKKIPFAFRGNTGQKLQGYFYSYDKPIANKLIIFDHGMGGGHRSYFREIETLAKKGYLVFSYDHTGCMESEGENTRGFAQSLNDLDCCVKALKKVDFLKGFDISVIGHSWGGFSSMNISDMQSLNSVVGGLASSGLEYGLTGKTTLNAPEMFLKNYKWKKS